MDDDQISFGLSIPPSIFDSDEHFEDFSLYSWQTESEYGSERPFFRGWREPLKVLTESNNGGRSSKEGSNARKTVLKLADYAARVLARHYNYDMLQSLYNKTLNIYRGCGSDSVDSPTSASPTDTTTFPEKLFMKILRWSFPDNDEDIRIYSCLESASADEYCKGRFLRDANGVRDVIQIGYHLSALVLTLIGRPTDNTLTEGELTQCDELQCVSVQVDRCRVISSQCSCSVNASWCQHVVAACSFRIYFPEKVEYRTTVWNSINELNSDQLKKFSLFFINELPRQYLTMAQGLIDQLKNPSSSITVAIGAPDPTDGGPDNSAVWSLPMRTLTADIRKIFSKFCEPAPMVHCDVHQLYANPHPSTSEFRGLLQPHRSKEPEGIWNLLFIVKEMFKRKDRNSLNILRVLTEECLNYRFIMWWWYQTSLINSGEWSILSNKSSSVVYNDGAPHFNSAVLCDEIVHLWRLAALNPALTPVQRDELASILERYHMSAVHQTCELIDPDPNEAPTTHVPFVVDRFGKTLSRSNATFTYKMFPGFLQGLEACYVQWSELNYHDIIDHVNGLSDENAQKIVSSACSVSNSLANRVVDNYRIDSVSNSLPNPVDRYRFETVLKSRFPIIRITTSHDSHEHQDHSRETHALLSHCTSADLKKISQPSGSQGAMGNEKIVMDKPGRNQSSGPSEILRRNIQETFQSNWFSAADVSDLFELARIGCTESDLAFALCEALYAHGFLSESLVIAEEIAKSYIRNPPTLTYPAIQDYTPSNVESRTYEDMVHQNHAQMLFDCGLDTSYLASLTFARVTYLVDLLIKQKKNERLAFELALNILRLVRSPAITNPLEVKIYHYETELMNLLNKIEPVAEELKILQRCAEKFLRFEVVQTPTTHSQVLPIAVAHYLFDKLACSKQASGNHSKGVGMLGFGVGIRALDLRPSVSGDSHSMHAECTRQRRSELVLSMLKKYKGEADKLALIIDKFLDVRLFQLFKDHPSNAAFFFEMDSVFAKYKCYPEYLFKFFDFIDVEGQKVSSKDAGSERISSGRNQVEQKSETRKIRSCSDSRNGNSTTMRNADALSPHLMELARRLYTEAGGRQISPIFNPATSWNDNNNDDMDSGQHRNLLLCSFFIALYALGVKNMTCRAWKSRTYSAFVSWIIGQAVEIGSVAFKIVERTWRGLLKPSEVANLADKASQRRDPATVQSAAELAISALSEVHCLSITEVRRIFGQCREHSSDLFEKALFVIEDVCSKCPHSTFSTDLKSRGLFRAHDDLAVNNGTMMYNVLFDVAKHWYELYCEKDFSSSNDTFIPHIPVATAPVVPAEAFMVGQNCSLWDSLNSIPPPPANRAPTSNQPNDFRMTAAEPTLVTQFPLWNQIPASHHAVQFQHANVFMGQRILKIPSVSGPSRQAGNLSSILSHTPFPSIMSEGPTFIAYPHLTITPTPICAINPAQNFVIHDILTDTALIPRSNLCGPTLTSVRLDIGGIGINNPELLPNHAASLNAHPSQSIRLLNAFRVGLKAMEKMRTQTPDENRGYGKFSRNPSYSDDVFLLYSISTRLGFDYVQKFCESAAQSIMSPFLLFSIIKEITKIFPRNMHPPCGSQIPAQILPSKDKRIIGFAPDIKSFMLHCGYVSPVAVLMQRCLDMYYAAVACRLGYSRFFVSDIEDAVQLVQAARETFVWLPGNGRLYFDEFLWHVRKQKAYKKDVARRINELSEGDFVW